MVLSIEIDINRLLIEKNSSEFIGFYFLNKWKDLNAEEVTSVCNFLINTHQYEKVLIGVAKNPQIPFPWAQLAFALNKCFDTSHEKIWKLFISAAQLENKTQEISRITDIHHLAPHFPEMNKIRKEEIQDKYNKLKSNLLEQLLFHRGQKHFAQEKKSLDYLTKLFPKDSSLLLHEKIYTENVALETLTKAKFKKVRPKPEDSDNEKLIKTIHLSATPKANEDNAFDLALMMYSLEGYEEALFYLKLAKDSPATDWLKIEVYLKLRRFLEVIRECDLIEKKYYDDPDTCFAASYLKAQAYNGVGQTEIAISILEDIIALRPNYRSAVLLINQWKEHL